jgi:hypothetical protein
MPVAFYAAWLPRSFTLNALVRQSTRTPSQPDICAFGGEIRIVFGEADPPSANCRAAKILEECSLLLPSRHEKK